jgi:hypothetical protein
MSTMSVSNITTANSTEALTMSTGNTAGAKIVVTQNDSSFTGNVAIFRLLANAGLGVAGQALLSGGPSANAYWGAPKVAVKETVYAANGTHTRDANLVSMVVYCVGGGGGGGGSNSAATAGGTSAGAGGGGGGVSIKILQAAEVGATSNVVVGIGGAGAASSVGNAGAGSNSTFANSTNGLITGQGGSNGQSVTAATVVGGAGGPAINGDLMIPGQRGGDGWANATNSNNCFGGFGGASGFGFGGGAAQVRSSAVGYGGSLYGGGGGGSASANSGTAARVGGNGANGVVWVVEYYTT